MAELSIHTPAGRRFRSIREGLVEALAEGPSTTRALAARLGLTRQQVSASLCQLRQQGQVEAAGKARSLGPNPQNVWSLA